MAESLALLNVSKLALSDNSRLPERISTTTNRDCSVSATEVATFILISRTAGDQMNGLYYLAKSVLSTLLVRKEDFYTLRLAC